MFFLCVTNLTKAQEKYEVISSSNLNVRSSPTSKSKIVGSLKQHETIDVYSFTGTWAKISYKDKNAYVHSKFIRKIKSQDDSIIIVDTPNELSDSVIVERKDDVVEKPILDKTYLNANRIGIDFLATVYGGFSNFVSDHASPKGTFGFGIDAGLKFMANDVLCFIPKNYFMEASLGYSMRGNRAFPMHYIMMKLSPVGYRYKIDELYLSAKIGAYVGYTFSTIETDLHTFDSNVDVGILSSLSVEYEGISLGVSYERGFMNVCDSNLKLKNQCIFLNLSYTIANLK